MLKISVMRLECVAFNNQVNINGIYAIDQFLDKIF